MQHEQPLSPLSEDAILTCLGRHFPLQHASLVLGRGDDCAIFKGNTPMAVSSDLFLEDVHFRTAYFEPDDIGYKALAVNVSDLAACGARPVAFNLCLGLPEWVDMAWLERFFAGMASLATEQGMVLSGGDLSRSGRLHVSITVFGEPTRHGFFLLRGASMPGDSIFLVGQPGLARVGLDVLERHGRAAMDSWPHACAAHLRPRPQVDAGLMLARAGANARPPALMDVSDGLARDLPRFLGHQGEPGAGRTGRPLGATLLLPQGLLHPEVVRWAREQGKNPVHEALLGGEDYTLLGSCAPDMLPALHTAITGFVSIGSITEDGNITCNNQDMRELQGFDHFAGA